jgi:hypothetical protein
MLDLRYAASGRALVVQQSTASAALGPDSLGVAHLHPIDATYTKNPPVF